MNAKVRFTSQQVQEFMELGGKGGYIKEAGIMLTPMKEFVKQIINNPVLKTKPEAIRNAELQRLIRIRQNAIIGYMVVKYENLTTQVTNQIQVKAELDAGTLSPTVPLDFDYVKSLFNKL